jgi:hypothetical protein
MKEIPATPVFAVFGVFERDRKMVSQISTDDTVKRMQPRCWTILSSNVDSAHSTYSNSPPCGVVITSFRLLGSSHQTKNWARLLKTL